MQIQLKLDGITSGFSIDGAGFPTAYISGKSTLLIFKNRSVMA
jgi:hypothetical protein